MQLSKVILGLIVIRIRCITLFYTLVQWILPVFNTSLNKYTYISIILSILVLIYCNNFVNVSSFTILKCLYNFKNFICCYNGIKRTYSKFKCSCIHSSTLFILVSFLLLHGDNSLKWLNNDTIFTFIFRIFPFTSLPCGKTQCMVVDGEASEEVEITFGVPHRSVPGPIVFLIYICT